jgi:hypothetical protein
VEQREENGLAMDASGNQLAVDDAGAHRQLQGRRGDRREAPR